MLPTALPSPSASASPPLASSFAAAAPILVWLDASRGATMNVTTAGSVLRWDSVSPVATANDSFTAAFAPPTLVEVGGRAAVNFTANASLISAGGSDATALRNSTFVLWTGVLGESTSAMPCVYSGFVPSQGSSLKLGASTIGGKPGAEWQDGPNNERFLSGLGTIVNTLMIGVNFVDGHHTDFWYNGVKGKSFTTANVLQGGHITALGALLTVVDGVSSVSNFGAATFFELFVSGAALSDAAIIAISNATAAKWGLPLVM